jgi:hypothetical protein
MSDLTRLGAINNSNKIATYITRNAYVACDTCQFLCDIWNFVTRVTSTLNDPCHIHNFQLSVVNFCTLAIFCQLCTESTHISEKCIIQGMTRVILSHTSVKFSQLSGQLEEVTRVIPSQSSVHFQYCCKDPTRA